MGGGDLAGGEWEEGSRRRGRGGLIFASSPTRGCGGDAPLFRPGSGEQGREAAGGGGPVRPDGPGGRGGG